MTDNNAALKNKFRKECRQIREKLGEDFRHLSDTAIIKQIENWKPFCNASVILTYMPIKAEVDLRMLFARFPEKNWVLPRILPETDHLMQFHQYLPDRMIRHAFGMQEPQADLPVIPPEAIDLVLVPGLAYDQEGWRLGYGGGYYDRFLKGFMGTSLGVIYDALLLNALPHDANDVQMDFIVSENGIILI